MSEAQRAPEGDIVSNLAWLIDEVSRKLDTQQQITVSRLHSAPREEIRRTIVTGTIVAASLVEMRSLVTGRAVESAAFTPKVYIKMSGGIAFEVYAGDWVKFETRTRV